EQHNGLARFLEAKGMVTTALDVATDQDYRFDLAVQLGDLSVAQEIAAALDSTARWKQLGQMALTAGKLDLASDCLTRASDFSGLLMLSSARGDRAGMGAVAAAAGAAGKTNVAFLGFFLLGRLEDCLVTLLEAERLPEAAFFARTYVPSSITPALAKWKVDLAAINPKAAESLADPAAYPNLFPHLEEALRAEKMLEVQRTTQLPAVGFVAAAATVAAATEGGLDGLLLRLQGLGLGDEEVVEVEEGEEEEAAEEAEEAAAEDEEEVELDAEEAAEEEAEVEVEEVEEGEAVEENGDEE
ncbi:putative coatomer subunit beta'-3, partial [Tetrabaena socialis]